MGGFGPTAPPGKKTFVFRASFGVLARVCARASVERVHAHASSVLVQVCSRTCVCASVIAQVGSCKCAHASVLCKRARASLLARVRWSYWAGYFARRTLRNAHRKKEEETHKYAKLDTFTTKQERPCSFFFLVVLAGKNNEQTERRGRGRRRIRARHAPIGQEVALSVGARSDGLGFRAGSRGSSAYVHWEQVGRVGSRPSSQSANLVTHIFLKWESVQVDFGVGVRRTNLSKPPRQRQCPCSIGDNALRRKPRSSDTPQQTLLPGHWRLFGPNIGFAGGYRFWVYIYI